MKKILKIKEVAQHLDIPLRTLYDMLNDGRFSAPCIPGTKPRRWTIEAVEAWRLGQVDQ